MELDLTTPVSHPPSRGTGQHSRSIYPPKKNIFASIKISKILSKYFFIFKKSEKEFDKLTFGNRELVEHEI
jgi:hypothetical protein